MTKSFDEFWGEFAIGLNADENEAESIYEAGQQSKQAEVDELQKRIDEINKLVDLWREDYITLVKYDDGNRYCLEDCINRVVNALEGNTNEHCRNQKECSEWCDSFSS